MITQRAHSLLESRAALAIVPDRHRPGGWPVTGMGLQTHRNR